MQREQETILEVENDHESQCSIKQIDTFKENLLDSKNSDSRSSSDDFKRKVSHFTLKKSQMHFKLKEKEVADFRPPQIQNQNR